MNEETEKKGKGNITPNRNAAGEIISYRFRCCVGRERNKQIWRSCTIPRPIGFTPKKEEKEVNRLYEDWKKVQKDEYESNRGRLTEELRKEKNRITLSDFIEKIWIEKHVKDGNHTPDTIAFYISMGNDIKNYLKDKSPGLKLIEVDKQTILDYLAYLRKEAKTKKGNPYSKATIQHHFSTLRNVLEYAVYIEYIGEDPCIKLKHSDRPRREDREINFLDEDESIRFLACLDSEKEIEYWKSIKGSSLYWKTLVNALITTGLRRGELVGLQWKDIDKKNKMIRVRRNVTIDTANKAENDPEKKIHIGENKGKRIREVPIEDYLINLIETLKAEQENKYGGMLLPNGYVFCRIDNPYMPLYPTEPTRLMKKYVKRHKLPDISPHDLRHTAGYLAKASGADMKDIQELLGHRDAATTQKFYVGITAKAKRKTSEGIENLLRPKPPNEESKQESQAKNGLQVAQQ